MDVTKTDPHWHICEASAPYESARWAASDRGWLYLDGRTKAAGSYLAYPAGHIHAVAWPTPDGAAESRRCATPDEAQAWIEERCGVRQMRLFA